MILFLVRLTAYNFTLFTVWFLLIVSYLLFVITSAYFAIPKSKEYKSVKWDKWFFYVAIWIGHLLVSSAIPGKTLDNLTPINFASIPTPAMAPTLKVGDILAYDKTPLVTRNDVTVFKYPQDISTFFIKRCIGIPGDSLEIVNGVVHINGRPISKTYNLNYRYLISTDTKTINPRIFEQLDVQEYSRIANGDYVANVTTEQAKRLENLDVVNRVVLATRAKNQGDPMIFPEMNQSSWNTDYYGPIYLPRKGDQILLNETNARLYAKCIESENESAELRDIATFVNEEEIEKYVFKENYYFMMGDNRHNSMDSRYLGFVPEKLIVGKALYVLWGDSADRSGKDLTK